MFMSSGTDASFIFHSELLSRGDFLCYFIGSPQARNQEFFRAGEVSENKGTSINI